MMSRNMFEFPLMTSRTGVGDKNREEVNNLGNKFSVNDEYDQAFRTKSYIDIWSKVQGELGTSHRDYYHLSRYLIEPKQEFLMQMDLHPLLIDYFKLSLEACNVCGLLLQCIDQTRVNYCIIQSVIKLAKRVPPDDNDQCGIIFRELVSFGKLNNPFSCSTSTGMDFEAVIHHRYGMLLNQLIRSRDKNVKKAKIIHFLKMAYGAGLVVACVALVCVTLVLSIHGLVGIVAAPAIISCFPFGFFKGRKRMNSEAKSLRKKLISQLDAAAKGIYTVKRDFDTMSRLIMRLNNEIDHHKAIAWLCVRNKKSYMLKEVVREFQTHESRFLKQLGELEEHVYLCFVTINRARRLVIHEIMAKPKPQ
ncbi:hypothetical protein GIB67_026974 [Kingdonia uniflora]|uniref:Uncharacterized protein n=1 Tax=Kingdonia uniflora TaxID=39325 RepID=A0A7J7P1G1_9MAGN|nr:hypothetical protein GIB67_026974 [Kingdonia uniflora]